MTAVLRANAKIETVVVCRKRVWLEIVQRFVINFKGAMQRGCLIDVILFAFSLFLHFFYYIECAGEKDDIDDSANERDR